MLPKCLPVAIFAFNRPEKMLSVLNALRQQSIDHLIIFIDGPRGTKDVMKVNECRKIAEKINWVTKTLYFWNTNHGLNRITENIDIVMDCYERAVFLEDDCLPMNGFYKFMQQALNQYEHDKRVFSIGGYQAIKPSFFHDYSHNLVSSARFTCWGWATWTDRWEELQPQLGKFSKKTKDFEGIGEIAGIDIKLKIINEVFDNDQISWDLKVAISTLQLKKVHLLVTRGLVKNIGQNRSGVHGGISTKFQSKLLQNRNLENQMPTQLTWLDNTHINCEYSAVLREFVQKTSDLKWRNLLNRVKVIFKRYAWPHRERYYNLDLSNLNSNATQKRALLSYIVHPFSIPKDDPRFYNHINIWHAQEIVRILNNLGYNVDVIDYRDTKFIPKYKYDLFIGHGGINFKHIIQHLPEKTRKIFLSTGSYWKFHNEQEDLRFQALQKRKGVCLSPDRKILVSEEEALQLADGILAIGNEHTRQTYQNSPKIKMINGNALEDDTFDWCPKNYDSGRKHFLFFAGRGNIHKGLDILLEAFIGLDQHLWIGTKLYSKFANLYRRELTQFGNIHALGWIKPRSKKFYQTMQLCNFCILPSCSEGQSQSVIECMNQGLIPLVTPEVGIDVKNFGIFINNPTIENLRAHIMKVSSFSPERCKKLSFQARKAATSDYSQAKFSKNLKLTLKDLLSRG